jgi:hypothetical protein
MERFIHNFALPHPLPAHGTAIKRLAAPVIIPQRGPGSEYRDFVQAYAPTLKGCGIDEKTFIDFLAGFEKSIKASPYCHVFNLAVAVSVLADTIAVAPSVIVHATALWCILLLRWEENVYDEPVSSLPFPLF